MAKLNETATEVLNEVKGIIEKLKYVRDYECVWDEEGTELDKKSEDLHEVIYEVVNQLEEVVEDIERY